MEIGGKPVVLPAKATAVIQAMERRGWKLRARVSERDNTNLFDFYSGVDCVSATQSDLEDNWLLATLVKYDPEIRQATIDASFEAMCEILKKP